MTDAPPPAADYFTGYYTQPYVTVSATASAIVQRAWGTYEVITEGEGYKVKRLLIDHGKATSYQFHRDRDEYHFHVKTGQVCFYGRGQWHQIENKDDRVLEVIEVQLGRCDELDIVRMTKHDATPSVDWDKIEADAQARRREQG